VPAPGEDVLDWANRLFSATISSGPRTVAVDLGWNQAFNTGTVRSGVILAVRGCSERCIANRGVVLEL